MKTYNINNKIKYPEINANQWQYCAKAEFYYRWFNKFNKKFFNGNL